VDGIPPAPAETQQVKLAFAFDEKGVLKVTATILSTGKIAEIVINVFSRETLDDSCDAQLDALHRQYRSPGERDQAELARLDMALKVQCAAQAYVNRAKSSPAWSDEKKRKVIEKANEVNSWFWEHKREPQRSYEEKLKELRRCCEALP
jgi:molecular chaperone DnaK (HSP70)